MANKETLDKTGWMILKGILIFFAVCLSAVFISQTQEGSNFISTIIVGLILLFIIWAYPNEQVRGIKKRMQNYKKFMIRLGQSVLIFLIFVFSIPTMAKNLKIAKVPTPEPTIKNYTVDSGSIYIGTGYSYELKFTVNNVSGVKINDNTVEPNNGEYVFSGNIATGGTSQRIKIYANNEHKNSTTEIQIKRDLSEQEIAEAKAKAEKEKADALAKAEKDRLAQEALVAQQKKEAELAEKKAKQEQAKKAQEKTRIEAKYERIMKSGYYLYELEGKLFDLGFEQTTQGYGDAPDGSTQIITYYAKDEGAFRVVISLQNGYALGKYWYTVEAKEY